MTQHYGGLVGRCFNEWCCPYLQEKLRNSLCQQYTELCATREKKPKKYFVGPSREI